MTRHQQRWVYAHFEIEAACGGEMAHEIRALVLKRRERIDKELASRLNRYVPESAVEQLKEYEVKK